MPSPSGPISGPHRHDPAYGPRGSHRAGEAPVAGSGTTGDARFTVVLRGYDRGEVEGRLADLDRRLHDEGRRAESAEKALSAARAQTRRLQEQADAASAAASNDQAGFGRRVERVLQAAEDEAAELRERALGEAAELREQALTEADEIVARAHEQAEERRARTEEALLGRAATLDREFGSRDSELDEREDALARREAEIAERAHAAEEHLSSAGDEADRILSAARSDADDVLAAARIEAERDASERRARVNRDIERLAALRDEIRNELGRVRDNLNAELDRGPVSATVDETLFGSRTASGSSAAEPDDSALDPTRSGSWPSGEDSSSGTLPSDRDSDDSSSDGDHSTGTLLLGPGRRSVTVRDHDDVESTTIGQIPPVSLTTIGVLPFSELGTGRESARTRNDGVNGASRAQRGGPRGSGSGRRSR